MRHLASTALAASVLVLLAACDSSSLPVSAAPVTPGAPGTTPTPPVTPPADPANAPKADGSGSNMTRKPQTGFTAHNSSVPLNFLILGDAGTNGNEPASEQVALGEVMGAVCNAKKTAAVPGCHFALAAGDNIYYAGATNVTDPQFQSTFEIPYAPVTMPFYLVLGNHDNGVTGNLVQLGDNQVEYHYLATRTSNKWNMPARYYTQRFGSVMELFAMDSDTVQDADVPAAQGRSGYDGPFQQRFIADALRLSPARWKFSMTHYNYISNGNYGDGSPTFKAAMEASICDKVQFHIQGHEHDMRWLKPVASCGRTEFIVSGAAGRTESRPATNLGFAERKGEKGLSDYRASSGFMWASILGDTLTVEWYGINAENANPPRPVETFRLTRRELGFTD